MKRSKTAERRKKAIALYTAGLTWQAIADQLDYASRGAACTDVTRALEKDRKAEEQQVEALRYIASLRLERIQAGLWPKATKGDVKSAEAATRVIDRWIKLHGLDAPRRFSVEAENLGEEITALLADLTQDDGSGDDPPDD